MSRTLALAAFFLASAVLFAQDIKIPKFTSAGTLSKFCGRLQVGTVKSNSDTRTKGLHGVTLQLYRLEAGQLCCASKDYVGATKTGLGGRFNFYRAQNGSYWLVARYQSQAYALALNIKRNPQAEVLCGDQQFVIWSDGRFDMQRYVTLD